MNKQSSLYRRRPGNCRTKRKKFRKGKTRKTYAKIKDSLQVSIFNYFFEKGVDTVNFERPLFIDGSHQFAGQIFNDFGKNKGHVPYFFQRNYENDALWRELAFLLNDLEQLKDEEALGRRKAQIMNVIEAYFKVEFSVDGSETIHHNWKGKSEL